jgi:hypothetical protein
MALSRSLMALSSLSASSRVDRWRGLAHPGVLSSEFKAAFQVVNGVTDALHSSDVVPEAIS